MHRFEAKGQEMCVFNQGKIPPPSKNGKYNFFKRPTNTSLLTRFPTIPLMATSKFRRTLRQITDYVWANKFLKKIPIPFIVLPCSVVVYILVKITSELPMTSSTASSFVPLQTGSCRCIDGGVPHRNLRSDGLWSAQASQRNVVCCSGVQSATTELLHVPIHPGEKKSANSTLLLFIAPPKRL